jgi:uncharacterized damage-inducible protein DinB
MKMRWMDRTFQFTTPLELFPTVAERLRGTPARVEEKVRSLSPSVLTRRDGEAWSMQEHLGHLLDLDELHLGRLEDYQAGAGTLRAADMGNRKTQEADHNRREVKHLLQDFRRERRRFVERLESLSPEELARSAVHPRLRQPMRVIDMAWFVAEHDDHHLARMTELQRMFEPAPAAARKP